MDVEIEDPNTWPEDFRDLAGKNKRLILSFYREYQRQIDQRDSGILMPLPNKYKGLYQSLLHDLDKILFQHKIIGYHCTRLIGSEVTNIKNGGLKILSRALVHERIQSALHQGLLTKEEYIYLRYSDSIQASLNDEYGRRIGSLWFVPNLSTLKTHYSGLYRFFNFWGGEALYNGHWRDSHISNTLKRIGIPCIVKCSISFNDINRYPSPAARMISFMISNDIESPEPPYAFDLYMKRDLAASEVKDIIELSDPRFEHLTGHSNWPTRYKINC